MRGFGVGASYCATPRINVPSVQRGGRPCPAGSVLFALIGARARFSSVLGSRFDWILFDFREQFRLLLCFVFFLFFRFFFGFLVLCFGFIVFRQIPLGLFGMVM